MRLSAATLLALGLTTALPGCAAISALSGEPDRDVFELRPPSDVPMKCGRGRVAELVIEPPKTRGTLDTDRIMIRPSGTEPKVRFYVEARDPKGCAQLVDAAKSLLAETGLLP